MSNTILYTIGFTQKTAAQFFGLLGKHGINVVVDIRLRPDSQLSGFAKGRDLPYFLNTLIQCGYQHMPTMSPTDDLLDQYRKDKSWEQYEKNFNRLLEERKLIETLDKNWWQLHQCCLLCSEHKPDRCHRRLVAEYLNRHWHNIELVHLI